MSGEARVSGRPVEALCCLTVDRDSGERAVADLFDGRASAVLIKGFVDPASSREITRRFWDSQYRAGRPDGVPGDFLGAYHYGKPTNEYLDLVDAERDALRSLFRGTDDPMSRLRDVIRGIMRPRGIEYRVASWNGRDAGDCRAIAWQGRGEYALLPHDDVAQLTDPLQRDFEIQKATDVIALNIYPENPSGTGALKLWNMRPGAACRAAFRVEHTGYPYPPESLEGIEELRIDIDAGDACLLRGALIHAVTGDPLDRPLLKRRLLLTSFTGISDSRTAIWWT